MEIGKVMTGVMNTSRQVDSGQEIKQDLKNTKATTEVINEREQLTLKDLEEMTNSANEFFNLTNTSLEFQLHEDLNRYFVKVVDSQTNELVREIPPEKMLDMFAAMRELAGIMFDESI